MLAANATGYFPYTPATNMLYALDQALDMLAEEGLQNVFSRHDPHAAATRRGGPRAARPARATRRTRRSTGGPGKVCRTSSAATPATPRRRVGPCAPGAWRSS